MVSPGAGVELPPQTEGQPVVGAVPEQRVAEAQCAHSVMGHELVQSLPRRVEHIGDRVDHVLE